MAPAKKRGAPASAKRERPSFILTPQERADKKARNKAKHKAGQATALQEAAAAKAEMQASASGEWPLKAPEYWGKDDPALPTEKVIRQGPTGRLPMPRAKYSDKLGEMLYELVATGHGLDAISKLAGTPGLVTMLGWLRSESHPFSSLYAQAREAAIPLLEDRAMSVALNPQQGVIRVEREVLDKNGVKVKVVEERVQDAVERSKLALSAYQWVLSWRAPKKHGKAAQPGDDGNDALKQLLGQFRARSEELDGDDEDES